MWCQSVLADLQGPKLRLGEFADGRVRLKVGQDFRLDRQPLDGDASRVCVPHAEIFAALKPGAHILLDDGKVRLKVGKCGPDFADTVVVAGEALSNHKGLNLPGLAIPIPALTAKDLEPLIGRSNRVYEVLNRKRGLTLAMIQKLHLGLGIPAESLLRQSAPAAVR